MYTISTSIGARYIMSARRGQALSALDAHAEAVGAFKTALKLSPEVSIRAEPES